MVVWVDDSVDGICYCGDGNDCVVPTLCTTSVRRKMWCYCYCYCADRRCYWGACTQCTVRMAHSDACVVPTATATVVTEDSTGVAAQCTMHSAQ